MLTDTAAVDNAVIRYAQRYGRTPAPNPERVVIEITIDRAMGQVISIRPTTGSTAT